MIFYSLGATLTFGILLDAFHRDTEAPKTDVLSWAVLIIATLIWFITLPRIMQKKLQSAKAVSSVGAANSEGWMS
ncbi:hypothetical protein [Leptolyngbya ohadii]|uniref:hypothetical protein n=1 Tax=Leptolyngbya ohadii TaxID=1962290 RepID=UPI000B5A0EF2|nr:hypothetical protein [Leptolyngbya ohadii]